MEHIPTDIPLCIEPSALYASNENSRLAFDHLDLSIEPQNSHDRT